MQEVDIVRLGVHGEGVGYLDGCTVFVDGALPGERAQVDLYERRKRFARGSAITIINPSKERVVPPCPYFGRCGGCQLMHMRYEAQLVAKRQRVVDAFERIAKVSTVVHPCRASPNTMGYRNKVSLLHRQGQFGFCARHSHDLVAISRCRIHNELGETVFAQLHKLLDTGAVTQVVLRTAVRTAQVLVVLVTDSKKTQLHTCAERLFMDHSAIRGVVHKTKSQRYTTLCGDNALEESLGGFRFFLSAGSFFQVNLEQAEQLYAYVVAQADLSGSERVLDAYCGVGTLTLHLARSSRCVYGVESVESAVCDARRNARENGVANVQFTCAAAEAYMPSLTSIDVAAVNPPRGGCALSFLESLAALKPQKIIYVSCDPATLARDAAQLQKHGYVLVEAMPFDMFPQTAHVETVATFRLGISVLF